MLPVTWLAPTEPADAHSVALPGSLWACKTCLVPVPPCDSHSCPSSLVLAAAWVPAPSVTCEARAALASSQVQVRVWRSRTRLSDQSAEKERASERLGWPSVPPTRPDTKSQGGPQRGFQARPGSSALDPTQAVTAGRPGWGRRAARHGGALSGGAVMGKDGHAAWPAVPPGGPLGGHPPASAHLPRRHGVLGGALGNKVVSGGSGGGGRGEENNLLRHSEHENKWKMISLGFRKSKQEDHVPRRGGKHPAPRSAPARRAGTGAGGPRPRGQAASGALPRPLPCPPRAAHSL